MLTNKSTKVIGHRGAAGVSFENSLSGFYKAIEIGVTCIEIDVWQIETGELIVFHDPYLDRLTDRSGSTALLTSSEISTLLLKNGEKIPLLEEVVRIAKQNNLQLIVEVKNERAFAQTYATLSKALDYSSFVIGSFFHQGVMDLKRADESLQTSIMFEGVFVDLDNYLNLVNPDYVIISIETYNQHLVDITNKQGRKLVFYTVNSGAEIDMVNDVDPYGIITNFPNLFIAEGKPIDLS
jgi:glycerophosphoryl diester phosphodiesterase